jgi:hypothetical protein
MKLVEASGFDALDSGSLNDSWRQQPGTPAYCTELTANELKSALRSAESRKMASKNQRQNAENVATTFRGRAPPKSRFYAGF